ncbi:antibiotic biosynthesis monooxygenase [Amycolatopsis antarctica]|uniref:Antibiotic biosynthesis monooxygenase n=1 Tax=Amycolatopsis antarctica TaxID=1854586 RepID=A0A263D0C6_9PSEU|nr:antibiotic biosynthesis monooxygenase family protein [Amycolatopsis antarctica]OZM70996.1 antibiotic biosynthesis monooxygenase [Amycolatopsis antarctica]
MIIIAGRLYVAPGERDGYLRSCRDAIEQARVSAGCLDYSLTADPVEPGRINVYERWESNEELMRFRGDGPDSAQHGQILDASVAKYRISSVEEP